MASTSSEKPDKIIRTVKRPLEEDVIVDLPSSNALYKRVKRQRSGFYGPENTQGTTFVVPDQYKEVNGSPFYIGEYNENNKRAVVFALPFGLQQLCSCDCIMMDGTFRVSPLGFSQLYSVHSTIKCKGNYLSYRWCR